LKIGTTVSAVEITTLTQHVSDGRGGTKSRLSEDAAAVWVAQTLNAELQSSIPDGRVVMLTLTSPVFKAKRTKDLLKEKIIECVSNAGESQCEVSILDNKINIHVMPYDGPSAKVLGAIASANSSPDILKNAWAILEDRIAVKAVKCSSLAFAGNKWLALLNDYWLADSDTYRQAFGLFSVDHPFEKILLVSTEGAITVLNEP
jgi:hypothetical protein